ncbi:acyltransferase [Vibrio cholerae]|nr:acyltransferase [Vibrio cholerae]EJL6485835.1 acyltransferase [Vibrio cholerae]EJL6584559.1 acyltransferase [Vibrio cholerae]EJL6888364.1 acyltransferase [Vibrio cholerae]
MKIDDEGMSLVRGVAALVVVVAHAIQIFILRLLGADHMVAKVAGLVAAQAVFVFFIVSGYLITLSIIKNTQRNNGAFNLFEYASARIARIYPPLTFAVVLCLILWALMRVYSLPGNDSVGAISYGMPNDLYAARKFFSIGFDDIKNAFLMNNGLLQVNGPLWSLCIEWRIYLAAACLGVLVTTKSWLQRIFWGTLFLIILNKMKAVDGNAYFYALIWATGSFVAIWAQCKFKMVSLKLFWVAPLLILISVWIFDPEFFLSSRSLSDSKDRALQFVFCLFWLGILFPRFEYRKSLFVRVMMHLGDFSYTLFIIHFPLMLFLLSVAQDYVGYSVVLSLIVAMSSIGLALILSCYAGRVVENKRLFSTIIDSWSFALINVLKSVRLGR